VDVTQLDTTKPWYIVHAQADLDGNGNNAMISEVVATSASNQIFTHNEGQ